MMSQSVIPAVHNKQPMVCVSQLPFWGIFHGQNVPGFGGISWGIFLGGGVLFLRRIVRGGCRITSLYM